MRKTLAYVLVALILPVAASYGQERTAGSALETQMTWSALSAQAKAASDKADAVNVRVDQVVVCARKGKSYAPGSGDAQGCVEAASTSGVNLTTMLSQISSANASISSVNANLTNSIAGTNNNVNNIINCNRSGLVFNGSGCITPAGGKTCTFQVTTTSASGGHNSSGPGACPSGYTMTGANGGSTDSTHYCGRVVCN